jgi:hypothetical protein
LGNFNVDVSESFFITEEFGIGRVNTKSYIFFLAEQKPLSFVSGQPVDLNVKLKEYNKTEFHHLMPRAYVKELDEAPKFSVNCLANYCFISRSENNHLGGVRPSKYKEKMPKNVDQILDRAACPASLFTDNFDELVIERAAELHKRLVALIK